MKSSSSFPVYIPLKEDIKIDFTLPKSDPPNVLTPLFGILIPVLMGILNRCGNHTEIQSPASHPHYCDLNSKASILDIECLLDEIKQYLNELVRLQGITEMILDCFLCFKVTFNTF
jgi:hypothetical protein